MRSAVGVMALLMALPVQAEIHIEMFGTESESLGTGSGPYSSTSKTLKPNTVYLASLLYAVGAGADTSPTMDGPDSLAWTGVSVQLSGATQANESLFWVKTDSDTHAGTIDVTISGETTTLVLLQLWEVRGATPAVGVVQSGYTDVTSGTVATVTLTALADDENAVFIVARGCNSGDYTVTAGYTEFSESGTAGRASAWKKDGTTTPAITAPSTGCIVAIAVEISDAKTPTPILRVGSGHADNGTQYDFPNWTPAADVGHIMVVRSQAENRAVVSPTADGSGNGITWVLRRMVAYDEIASPRQRLAVFEGAPTGSPTLGTTTVDFGVETQEGFNGYIYEVEGDPAGLVAQIGEHSTDDLLETIECSMSGMSDSYNSSLVVCSTPSPLVIDTTADWLVVLSGAGANYGQYDAWSYDETSFSATISSDDRSGCIMVELKSEFSSPSPTGSMFMLGF